MTTPHDFRYVNGKVQRRVKGGNWQRLRIVQRRKSGRTRPNEPTYEWKWEDID